MTECMVQMKRLEPATNREMVLMKLDYAMLVLA